MKGKIRLESTDDLSVFRIYLDGVDISRFVQKFDCHIEAGQMAEVNIELLFLPEIEEIMADIDAYVIDLQDI